MQTFPKPTLINVLLGCFSHHRLVSTRCSATCFLGVKFYLEFVVWNSLKETPSVMEHLKLQPPEYMNKKEESKVIHEFSRVLVFFLILFPHSCVFVQGHGDLKRIGAQIIWDVLEIMYSQCSSPIICPCQCK